MTEVIIPGWKTTRRTTENFFSGTLLGVKIRIGGVLARFFRDAIPLEIPPGVRRQSLWITWIIQSSFLRVLVFLLAQHNRPALVTDYHPIVWCDWASSRDLSYLVRWMDGDNAGYLNSIVMNPNV